MAIVLEFKNCEQCGKIFKVDESSRKMCLSCMGFQNTDQSDREVLRELKNFIRDLESKGQFMNIEELASATNVPEDKIWHFISTGEIGTSSFNDPDVKDFLMRKQRDLERKIKQGQEPGGKTAEDEANPGKPAGFHLKKKNERRK